MFTFKSDRERFWNPPWWPYPWPHTLKWHIWQKNDYEVWPYFKFEFLREATLCDQKEHRYVTNKFEYFCHSIEVEVFGNIINMKFKESLIFKCLRFWVTKKCLGTCHSENTQGHTLWNAISDKKMILNSDAISNLSFCRKQYYAVSENIDMLHTNLNIFAIV